MVMLERNVTRRRGPAAPPAAPLAALALVALLAAVGLAGCGGDGGWTRPNASPERAAADLEACERQAREETEVERDIDQDISVSRPSSAQIGGPMVAPEASAFPSAASYERAVAACMRGQGYDRAR